MNIDFFGSFTTCKATRLVFRLEGEAAWFEVQFATRTTKAMVESIVVDFEKSSTACAHMAQRREGWVSAPTRPEFLTLAVNALIAHRGRGVTNLTYRFEARIMEALPRPLIVEVCHDCGKLFRIGKAKFNNGEKHGHSGNSRTLSPRPVEFAYTVCGGHVDQERLKVNSKTLPGRENCGIEITPKELSLFEDFVMIAAPYTDEGGEL